VLRFLVFNSLFAGCCGYALFRGGAPERAMAIIFAMARLASISAVVTIDLSQAYRDVNSWLMIVDTVTLAAMICLALSANRYWPMWIASLQTVEVFAHVGKIMVPDMLPRGYQISVAMWSYLMLILLAAATWRHRRREVMFGAEPSWSSSSNLSIRHWLNLGPTRS
jgi:hypothetical protein